MTLKRWNRRTRQYDDFEIPDDWYVSVYETDMDILVNCPQCGCIITFGSTYTSLELHTPRLGFGYAVCPECHAAELVREMEANR